MPDPVRPQRAVQIRLADAMRHHGFGQHAAAKCERKGLGTEEGPDPVGKVRAEIGGPELPEHEHD